MMGAMQALERLWDRPAVRWPLVLVAVLVLFAGIRMVYVQNHHAAHVTDRARRRSRSASRPTATQIKLPQKAVDAARTSSSTPPSSARTSGAAGDISTAKVHAGLSRAQWMTGSIPVSPFPANAYGETRYKVEWSRSKNVTLLVQILPTSPTSRSGDFFIQMVPHGKTWLVDYFGPRGTNPPIPASEVH